MEYFYRLIIFIIPFFTISDINATHNRAGDIFIEQIGDCNDLKIRATIITYTKATAFDADRDSLEICWGDGLCELIGRINGGGNGEQIGNNTKVNEYVGYHQYGGISQYTISMTDPNRIDGILNVNPPFSVNVPFYIETTYTFLNPQFQGCNSTPKLLQPPIDYACVDQPFIHNPNAYDVDGDSLAYFFIVPKQSENEDVPQYTFPDQINPPPPHNPNNISIDPISGDIVWETPQVPGNYNIAFVVLEYRNGTLIGSTMRDMQIFVTDNCNNTPPTVDSPEEICIIAGTEYVTTISGDDIDDDQKVKLTALGGPLEQTLSPAQFLVSNNFEDPVVEGIFRWTPDCSSISPQYYTVIFKALDNFLGDTTGLSTLNVLRIKVVGPSPIILDAKTINDNIKITWEYHYLCDTVIENYFKGFSIWRKENSNPFEIDTCVTGLEGKGYEILEDGLFDVEGDSVYFYNDLDVEVGKTYCYRVLANFARESQGGHPYNPVESLPSNEFCVQIGRDLPLLTKVSIIETSNDGKIEINWTKPLLADLDTIQNPGPYTFKLFKSEGFSLNVPNPVIGAEWNSEFFHDLNDTTFIDQNGLNTTDTPYTYSIEFYTNGQDSADRNSPSASSVFLDIIGTDNKSILSWEENVPWSNSKFIIYRKNDISGEFDSIGYSNIHNYIDNELTNGKEYCYKIKSIGTYGINNIIDPIINFSQEKCAIPVDSVPPCPPFLEIENICNDNFISMNDSLSNHFSWTNPNIACEDTDDVSSYNIYFSQNSIENLQLLAIYEGGESTYFIDYVNENLSGCYAISAIDSIGNESQLSNIVCVDNCPNYELPNTFTPNGDNNNDLYIPIKNKFIDHINLKIFNRWGNLVYTTTDSKINWDGRNTEGKELSPGTYFYECKVYEKRITGIVESDKILTGFIEIIK